MEAVLRARDPVEVGWAASVMTNYVVETIWAVSDLPLPSRDLGTLRRHLDDLTVPDQVPTLLRKMLQSPPTEALRLQLQILDVVAPQLRQHD